MSVFVNLRNRMPKDSTHSWRAWSPWIAAFVKWESPSSSMASLISGQKKSMPYGPTLC